MVVSIGDYCDDLHVDGIVDDHGYDEDYDESQIQGEKANHDLFED